MGSLSLLQGIFPTQGSNPGLPHCRWILYQLSHKGSPSYVICGTSQVAQWWRICLPMQEMLEMWVWSLGWEDPLEKEMAAHCSILAWRIPWTEEPGQLYSLVLQRVRHDWMTEHACAHLICRNKNTELGKMRQQRNTFQMTDWDKSLRKELSKLQLSNHKGSKQKKEQKGTTKAIPKPVTKWP